MTKRRIAVVTGSRADYSLIYWVLRELEKSSDIDLQVIAAGMHLSPEFGFTYKGIEADGFNIKRKVEMLSSSDTPQGIARSTAQGIVGFCNAFMFLKPDIVLITGDRFEIFAAAIAAMFMLIPIAHIGGGDSTEGAVDEAIRHSITKMSQIHFCSNKGSYKKVLQLGEAPERVFCFGSPALDSIFHTKLLSMQKLYNELDLDIKGKTAIVTYHPATFEKNASKRSFNNLLKVLDRYSGNIVFTGVNADAEGRIINSLIRDYIKKKRKNAKFFVSLGRIRYFSLLKYAHVMLGNSSSGLCEAPSFKLPVVSIGIRQKGRMHAKNVIEVGDSAEAIAKGLDKALSDSFRRSLKDLENPYHGSNVSAKIARVLREVDISDKILQKEFRAR